MTSGKLVLIGTGGLGRETLWALRDAVPSGSSDGGQAWEVLGFLTSEESEHGTEVCGSRILGPESWIFDNPGVWVACCVGDPRLRRGLVERLGVMGVQFASVIHPSACMSEHVEVGEGCIVGARAVLTSQVRLGKSVVIGAGAVVSHDCRLDDFATLAPAVALAGGVHVEYGAELGVGASALPGQVIGRGAMVGAQAAVVHAVAPNTVVAGVPARQTRLMPEDRWL